MYRYKNQKLNLPEQNIRFRTANEQIQLFDPVRKKWVLNTPEEWVRQNFVHYLLYNLGYPAALMAVEMPFKLNNLQKRSDIVVFNRTGTPVLIVECKAPEIPVNQKVFDQIVRYNMKLKVNFLVVTNGLKHAVCQINYENQGYRFLQEIPGYAQMINE